MINKHFVIWLKGYLDINYYGQQLSISQIEEIKQRLDQTIENDRKNFPNENKLNKDIVNFYQKNIIKE
jgi:hypothetical protein